METVSDEEMDCKDVRLYQYQPTCFKHVFLLKTGGYRVTYTSSWG